MNDVTVIRAKERTFQCVFPGHVNPFTWIGKSFFDLYGDYHIIRNVAYDQHQQMYMSFAILNNMNNKHSITNKNVHVEVSYERRKNNDVLRTFFLHAHGTTCQYSAISPQATFNLPPNVVVILNCNMAVTWVNNIWWSKGTNAIFESIKTNEQFQSLDTKVSYIKNIVEFFNTSIDQKQVNLQNNFCVFNSECPDVTLTFSDENMMLGLFELPFKNTPTCSMENIKMKLSDFVNCIVSEYGYQGMYSYVHKYIQDTFQIARYKGRIVLLVSSCRVLEGYPIVPQLPMLISGTPLTTDVTTQLIATVFPGVFSTGTPSYGGTYGACTLDILGKTRKLKWSKKHNTYIITYKKQVLTLFDAMMMDDDYRKYIHHPSVKKLLKKN